MNAGKRRDSVNDWLMRKNGQGLMLPTITPIFSSIRGMCKLIASCVACLFSTSEGHRSTKLAVSAPGSGILLKRRTPPINNRNKYKIHHHLKIHLPSSLLTCHQCYRYVQVNSRYRSRDCPRRPHQCQRLHSRSHLLWTHSLRQRFVYSNEFFPAQMTDVLGTRQLRLHHPAVLCG